MAVVINDWDGLYWEKKREMTEIDAMGRDWQKIAMWMKKMCRTRC